MQRTKGWLIASSIVLGVGAGMAVGGNVECWRGTDDPNSLETDFSSCYVGATGIALGGLGLIGVIVSSVKLSQRKRELRTLEEAKYAKPRRARWDLETSRLVF